MDTSGESDDDSIVESIAEDFAENANGSDSAESTTTDAPT